MAFVLLLVGPRVPAPRSPSCSLRAPLVLSGCLPCVVPAPLRVVFAFCPCLPWLCRVVCAPLTQLTLVAEKKFKFTLNCIQSAMT